MAYTREQIGQALKAAHEAGDVEAARTLAIAYRDWKPATSNPEAGFKPIGNLNGLGRSDDIVRQAVRIPSSDLTQTPEQLDAFDAQRAAEKERLRVPDNDFKERAIIGMNVGTSGFGPYAAAGASTVGALLATPFVQGDIIDREGVSGAMSNFLDDARVHQRRAREERPLESFGTEIVGGVLQGKTFIDTLGRKFLPKTNTVSNVGRVVGTGTGYGTLYGFGQSESDTLQGALGDAAYGGATGAVFGLGFKAAEPAVTAGYRSVKTAGASLSDALSDMLGRAGGARDKVAGEVAIAAVRRSADRSGLTMEQMLDLVKKYEGKPAVLAEIIGQDALNSLTALTRRPGSTSQKATDIAEARATMLPDRAKGDLEDASGIQIGNIDETLTKQLDERQAAAKPLYDALYKQYRTIESFRQPGQTGQVQKRLNRLARTPILQRHLELADKAMRTSAAVRGIAVSKMSVMERWDLVKRSLDDAIDSAVAKGEARTKVGESVGDLVRLKDELVGELDRLTGDAYAAVRLAGGEAPRLRAAATAGQKAIGARSPKEVAKTVAATLAQDLPAMQAGMVDDIATRIDKPGFSPRRFRSPDLSGKVRAVFGEEAGNRFLQKMDAEAELAMKGSRWAPNVNSVTGTVMESGATAMGDDLINAGFDLATGNKVGFVRKAINFMRQRGFSQRQIDAIGDLLLSSPEEGLRRLQVIKPEGPPAGLAAPVAGGAPPVPPAGGTPTPTRPAGFGIGPNAQAVLQQSAFGSLGGSAYGSQNDVNGDGVIDKRDAYAGAFMGGIGLPLAARGVRTVGRPRGAVADTAAAGMGTPKTPQQAASPILTAGFGAGGQGSGRLGQQTAVEFARGRPNELQLLTIRKRQIQYDQRIGKKDAPNSTTPAKTRIELDEINARLKELKESNVAPPEGPPKGRTVGKGKLGTRTADAAAIATLGLQGGTAEADTGKTSPELKTANERVIGIEAKINKLDNETIPTLEEQIRLLQDYKADPREKQRILIARGHDLGTFGPNKDGVDGDLRPGSYSAKAVISEVAKIEADIARRRKEREGYTNELATAVGEVNTIQVKEAEQGGKPATPFRDKVLEAASYGAGIYLAHRVRKGGLNAAQKNATAIESKANALLSRRPPVPPVPDRTALGSIPLVGQPIEKALFPNKVARNTSATDAAARAAQAAEPRLSGDDVPPISPDPTSPDGLPTRVANLNKYYLDGGAERQLPVEDLGNGQFAMRSDVMPDYRLYGPKGPIGRFVEPVTSRFRTGDVAVTAGGALDYTVMSGMVEQTRADIKTAEEELKAARAANGGLGNATRIDAAKKDIEKLETIESVQVGFQRLGLGMMGFGLLGGMHGKYARPQPRHEAAIRERNLIAQAISPAPIAPPPAPVVPPPSTTVNAFASPPPKPKKPRTVGKPKPTWSGPKASVRTKKPANDNDR